MDEKYLADRFCSLWQECGGQDAEGVWQSLQRHYQEPHRHYHSLRHITQCLRELDIAKDHITELQATEMALWFHDIIYHYGARDNEILSAAYFRDVAGSDIPTHFVDRVCEFIIATQHTGVAQDASVAFVVDIDLSGFGLSWESYRADSDALRLEADNISDDKYYEGKLRFLGELQTWPNLYQSPFFRGRLEVSAQSNIARYTTSLYEEGFGAPLLAKHGQ